MNDIRSPLGALRRASPAALIALAGCGGPFTTSLDDYGPRPPLERLREVDRLAEEQFPVRPEPEQRRDPASDLFAGKERVEISLEQCRAWALSNNLDLQVALIDPVIANQAVNEEEGRFEAVLFNRSQITSLDQPTDSTLSGSQVNVQDFETGVRIPLRTGGQVTVALPLNRTETDNQFSTLNPSYEADFSASISQPLLRGAGRRASTFGVRIAALNEQISEARTKLEVIRQLANVERAYWRLFAQRAALDVTQQQYELAMEQLERARRQVSAGRSPEVEVVRAEAGVADRLEAIIVAYNDLTTVQRDLKRLINVPGLTLDTETLLVPATPPDPLNYDFDGPALSSRALASRMELLELELQLAQDASRIDFERNQALPLFTVDYTYRMNGLGRDYDDAFHVITDEEFDDHVFGFNVEIPLGNVQARSRVERAILQRLQRLSTKEARELAIEQEVLNAVDAVESDWLRILASRQSSLLNARTYDAEKRQFEVGARTSTDVLDAATRLADSQLAEIRALAEYQISLVDLAFSTGTLLGASRVEWSPYDPRKDKDPVGGPPFGAFPPESRPEGGAPWPPSAEAPPAPEGPNPAHQMTEPQAAPADPAPAPAPGDPASQPG